LTDLRDLYQEIILDHYRNPRNKHDLEHLEDVKVHDNPTCGDTVKTLLHVDEEGRVGDLKLDARGCAICVASASMMSELVAGEPVARVRAWIERFMKIMRGEEGPESLEEWGDLAALAGIIKFPVRVKCATLAWHALDEAILARQDRDHRRLFHKA
jgi:nitrogen fixation NifU-like protein